MSNSIKGVHMFAIKLRDGFFSIILNYFRQYDLSYAWAKVRYFCWLIWVSRVPAFSAIVGAFLFLNVPQIADLLLEVQNKDFNLYDSVKGWFYFAFLFLGWIFPVYFTSIALIKKLDIHPLSRVSEVEWMRRLVPLLLVLIILGALSKGHYNSWINVGVIWSDFVEYGEIPDIVLSIQVVMIATAIFIGMFVIPNYFKINPRSHLSLLAGLVLVSAILWTIWIGPAAIRSAYDARTEIPDDTDNLCMILLRYGPTLLALLGLVIYSLQRTFFVYLAKHFRRTMFFWFSTIIIFILFLASPFYITGSQFLYFPVNRYALMFFLLGAWVPFVAWIGYWSHRVKAPLIFLSFIPILAIGYLPNSHKIRIIPPTSQSKQLSLQVALRMWQEKHKCDNAATKCPPLILVSVEGGASRAAFFSTTVLGELVDRYSPAMNAAPVTGAKTITSQIFAISGVSGGSLGVATFAATLKDSIEKSGGHALSSPCREYKENGTNAGPDLSLWHRANADGTDESKDRETYRKTWRNCLQAILSDDFLSPTLIRFVFSDFFGVTKFFEATGIHKAEDRAHILAKAWERRYKEVVGRDTLTAPFLEFLPKDEPGTPWQPLLLLNGTSVETGRRIIASHLAPWYCAPNSAERSRLFPGAYDLHELFKPSGTEQKAPCDFMQQRLRLRTVADLSLSEAILVSARFPIISPPGRLILNGTVYDAVVDGGYFDSSGLATLRDLAAAISRMDKHQKIVNLFITNDPIDPRDQKKRAPEPAKKYEFDTPVPAVLRALMNARTGRSEHAGVAAREELQSYSQPFFHIAVYEPQPEPSSDSYMKPIPGKFQGIPMSWWLSQQVQRYLDNQLPIKGVRYKTWKGEEDKTVGPGINESVLCELIKSAGTSQGSVCKN